MDAILHIRDALEAGAHRVPESVHLDPSKKLIIVATHRRESFGDKFERISPALADLAQRGDVQIVYPVHPNPKVQDPVKRILKAEPNIDLIEPLSYVPLVDLNAKSLLIAD